MGNTMIKGVGGNLLSPSALERINNNYKLYEQQIRDKAVEETYENAGGFIGGLGYLGEKVGVGFVQSFEGIVDYAAGGLAKLFGADDWAEKVFQNDWMNYSHPDEWFKPSKGWQVAGDVAGGIGTSMPSIIGAIGGGLLIAGTGGAAAPAGVKLIAASLAPLAGGLAAAGTSTSQAVRETGELTGKELAYGALSGATEAGIEFLSSGLGAGTAQIATSITKRFAKETAKTIAKQSTMKTLAKGFLGEAFEEGIEEIIDPYWQRLTYNPDAKNATPQEVLYSAIIGGMSGMIMSGADAAVNAGLNFNRGNKIMNNGTDAEVLGLAGNLANFEKTNKTGDATFAGLADTYDKLTKSMESTGGRIETFSQKKMLGELSMDNTAAIFKPIINRSAINIVTNADAIVERLNAYGYHTEDGKPVTFTVEQLTKGFDKNDPRTISKVLEENDILRSLAVADATGHLMMDTQKFAEATMRGQAIASQADINRLLEYGNYKQIAAVKQVLGIDDLSTIDAETFNKKVLGFLENGGAEIYSDRQLLKEQLRNIPEKNARKIPKMVNLRTDSSVRYTDGDLDIAITKNGDVYTMYNYADDALSKNLTRKEVNSLLREYNTEKDAVLKRIADERTKVAESEAKMREEVKQAETFAKENVKGYSELSEPNKGMIRRILRNAKKNGISDADAITYANIATRSGLDIMFDKSATYQEQNADGKGKYADAFYDANRNRIVVNPEATRTSEKLLLHELDHAIRDYLGKDGKRHSIVFKEAWDGVSQEQKERIAKAYEKVPTKVSKTELLGDEVNAYYAESMLSNSNTLEKLVEAEPTLADKILDFFLGASKDSDVKMSKAAKRYYKTYKKLFDSFADRNYQGNAVSAEAARMSGKVNDAQFSLQHSDAIAEGQKEYIEKHKTTITEKELGMAVDQTATIENIIPLNKASKEEILENYGEKVNKGKEDIRYSLEIGDEQVPVDIEQKGDLVALHNLSEENLIDTLNLGGFPMPSIAVVKAKDGHVKFGDITVVFGKDSISPDADKRNVIWSADAWTPMFPEIEKKLNLKLANQLYDDALKVGDIPFFIPTTFHYLNLEDAMRSKTRTEGIIESYGTKNFYLATVKNDPVEMIRTEKETIDEREKRRNEYLIQSLGEKKILDIEENSRKEGGENEYRNALMGYYTDVIKLERAKAEKMAFSTDWYKVERTFDRVSDFINNGKKTTSLVNDEEATRKAIDEKIDEKEYKKWAKELFSNLSEKEGIRNQKDTFTPSGERRTFEQTHYEVTLDNIVKAMTEQGDKAVGAFGNNLFGATAKEYGSFEEFKKAADKVLKKETEEEHEKHKKEILKKYEDAVSTMVKESGFREVSDLVTEGIIKYKTKLGIQSYIRREGQGWINYNQKAINEIMDVLDEIRVLPTSYFEAKPKRVVGFDEIKMVELPNTASEKLKAMLSERNIPYEIYGETDEQRTASINKLDDIRFSLDTDYMTAVDNGDMDAAKKLVEQAAKEWGAFTEKGKPKIFYHGTGAKFTKFSENKMGKRLNWGKGYYFGSNKSIAEEFAEYAKESGGEPNIISAYLQMENPYIQYKSSIGTAKEIKDKYFSDMWKEFPELGYDYISEKLESSPLGVLQFIAEHNKIEIRDVLKEMGYDGVKSGGEYVVFSPNQIKSADTVTYDDNGNIIPLSERFKTDNDDIRFALSADDDIYKDADSYEQFRKENLEELKKNGIRNNIAAKDEWCKKRIRKSNKHLKEIKIEDAVSIIREKVKPNLLDGWFVNADSLYKPAIVNAMMEDIAVRNAAINIMYYNYREINERISFDDFLKSKIELYRGTRRGKFIDKDEFISYSFDKKIADKFKVKDGLIEELFITPMETYGSMQTTAEYEIMVPRFVVENKAKSDDIRYALPSDDEPISSTRDAVSTKFEAKYEPTKEDKLFSGWTAGQIAFTNQQAGIEAIGKKFGVKDIESIVQAARAGNAQADEMIGGNQYRIGHKSKTYQGEGLEQIFHPIAEQGEQVQGDFFDYLFNYHNLSRMTLESRSKAEQQERIKSVASKTEEVKSLKRKIDYWQLKLEELGKTKANAASKKVIREKIKAFKASMKQLKSEIGKLDKDIKDFVPMQNKPVFGTKDEKTGIETVITAEQSKENIAKYEKKYPEFKKTAEKVWKFLQNLNQYRVDTGLISQDTSDYLQKLYPNYVPTYRVGDTKGIGAIDGKYNLKVKSTIKTAKGSIKTLQRPDVMIARQVEETVRAGRINQLANALYEAAEAQGDNDYIEIISREKVNKADMADFDPTTIRPKDNEVIFYRNGEKITMRVSKELFAGFDAFNPSKEIHNPILNWSRKANNLFKQLVTSLNPAFLIRNSVRDIQDAGINTRYGKTFVKNYARAAKEIASNGKMWQLYKAMGGFSSSLFDFDKGIKGSQNKWGLTKAEGNLLKKTLQSIENANAFVEQLPRLAEFISSIEAGNTAEQAILDSADVTTNFGRSGKIVKELNRTLIPFLNPSIQGFSKMIRNVTSIRSAKEFASLLFKVAIVGIVPQVLNMLMYGDDDDYKELRENDKENNFLFKVGDTFIKVPRGRVAGVIGGLVNRTTETIKGNDADWSGYFKNMVQQVSPVDSMSRTFFSPFADVANNVSWYGSPIEGRQFENVRPRDRYDESTSSIAIMLGKVFNYSPKKIHYLLDQYSGVIGDFILPATTKKAEKGFLSGNFTIDPKTSNRLSSDFYKLYDKAQYAKTDGNETAKYQVQYLNKVKSAVSEMFKRKSEIQNSDLSGAEKLQQTRVVQVLINEAYRTALQDYDLYTKALDATEGVDDRYRATEATRLVYGSQKALADYNKDVYAKCELLNKAGVSYDVLYNNYFTAKQIENTVDASGKPIPGTKRKQVVRAINRMNIPPQQKLLLIASSGYALRDGDYRGMSAEGAKRTLLRYILSMPVSREDKAQIAAMCGFEVRNGKIARKSAF